MKMRHTCAGIVMMSGMLFFAGGTVQGQVTGGSGSPSGGSTMGSGSGTLGGSSGGAGGSMSPGRESSGSMGREGREMSKPLPGGDPTGPGRTPNSSGPGGIYPTVPGGSGPTGSAGRGSGGSMGSSSGMGSGGGMGSSGGAGGGGK